MQTLQIKSILIRCRPSVRGVLMAISPAWFPAPTLLFVLSSRSLVHRQKRPSIRRQTALSRHRGVLESSASPMIDATARYFRMKKKIGRSSSRTHDKALASAADPCVCHRAAWCGGISYNRENLKVCAR